MDFRIPIGQWVETVVDWLRDNLSGLFDFITVVVRFLVDGLTDILLIIPILLLSSLSLYPSSFLSLLSSSSFSASSFTSHAVKP